MRNDLNEILFDLKNQRPLCQISILERISRLNWANYSNEEGDLLCELILRITADLIVFRSEKSVDNKNGYENIFWKIRNEIDMSDLNGQSEEFRSYFEKFCHFF